jgi:hypothetical protein
LPVLVDHSPDASVVVLGAASRLEAAATAEAEGFTGAEEPEEAWGRRRSPLLEGAVVDAAAAGAAALAGLAAGAVGWKASASAFSFKIC